MDNSIANVIRLRDEIVRSFHRQDLQRLQGENEQLKRALDKSRKDNASLRREIDVLKSNSGPRNSSKIPSQLPVSSDLDADLGPRSLTDSPAKSPNEAMSPPHVIGLTMSSPRSEPPRRPRTSKIVDDSDNDDPMESQDEQDSMDLEGSNSRESGSQTESQDEQQDSTEEESQDEQQDSTEELYEEVDVILAGCEDIGARLRSSMSSWTAERNDDTPRPLGDQGALSLRSMSGLKRVEQPESLSEDVVLKDYQLLGLNWLHLMYQNKYGCILADDMGLGKTVQVISFLALLQERGNEGPHLIVVPSSTLENWRREFARFAPSISVQTYHGAKDKRVDLQQTLLHTRRSKVVDKADGWDVLVTTYSVAQGDGDQIFFKRVRWDCCVYDEGHVLKNFQSQRYRSLLGVPSKWRLLLTGTPIQNDLQELVSLMNFILPTQFGPALDNLRQVFKVKGFSNASVAQERVSRAKKMMTPFVLRRRKDQVLHNLLKKNQHLVRCGMTATQDTIYREILKDDPHPLMGLRKAALHPMLFRRQFTEERVGKMAEKLFEKQVYKASTVRQVTDNLLKENDAVLHYICTEHKYLEEYKLQDECLGDSGKIAELLKILERVLAERRKILIFSQFVKVLDILELVLLDNQIKYLIITGEEKVQNRLSIVDDFTNDASFPVLLLSTKAGGVGINLIAATVVIIYDLDLNPHNDKQAEDRAYRIGQVHDVDVYRLISRRTVEEDIHELGQRKLELDEAVAGDGGVNIESDEGQKSLVASARKRFGSSSFKRPRIN